MKSKFISRLYGKIHLAHRGSGIYITMIQEKYLDGSSGAMTVNLATTIGDSKCHQRATGSINIYISQSIYQSAFRRAL